MVSIGPAGICILVVSIGPVVSEHRYLHTGGPAGICILVVSIGPVVSEHRYLHTGGLYRSSKYLHTGGLYRSSCIRAQVFAYWWSL